MFLPLGDQNVKGGHFPLFSYLFIAVNLVVYFFYQIHRENIGVCTIGALPRDLMRGEEWWTILSSAFAHGGLMHLLGNMLFLWIFSDNIEAIIGNVKFVIFYVLGAAIAVGAHVVLGVNWSQTMMDCCAFCHNIPCGDNICADTIPLVGASGAISAIMGAYLVMFPSSKIRTLVLLFMTRIPAVFFLLGWIGFQIWNVYQGGASSTAYWAHIGGFVFGVLAGFIFRAMNYQKLVDFKNDYPSYLK